MKLVLTINAEFEVEDFEDMEEVKCEVESVIDQLNSYGKTNGKLKLDVDSLKSRDRMVEIGNWE